MLIKSSKLFSWPIICNSIFEFLSFLGQIKNTVFFLILYQNNYVKHNVRLGIRAIIRFILFHCLKFLYLKFYLPLTSSCWSKKKRLCQTQNWHFINLKYFCKHLASHHIFVSLHFQLPLSVNLNHFDIKFLKKQYFWFERDNQGT